MMFLYKITISWAKWAYRMMYWDYTKLIYVFSEYEKLVLGAFIVDVFDFGQAVSFHKN